MNMPDQEKSSAAADRRHLLIAGALAISLLAHLPSLGIPFQLDDIHHLKENPNLTSPSFLPRYFIDPTLFTGLTGGGMYRPLLMATHNLTYALSGYSPAAFHAGNLLLHLLNTFLVFLVLEWFLKSKEKAAAGALFWSVAAAQQIAVGYISARSSLLASTFVLLSIIVTNRPGKLSLARSAGAAGLVVLALLSKETGFAAPFLLVLRDLYLARKSGGRIEDRASLHGCTFGVIIVYLMVRMMLLDKVLGEQVAPRELYLLTQAKVFFLYLAKIVFPVNLTLITGAPLARSLFSLPELAAALALAAAAAAAIATARRAPLLSLGFFWMLIGLAPTSSFATLSLTASLERLYLPLIGPIILAAHYAPRAFAAQQRYRQAALGLFAAIVLLNAAATVHRHLVWSSGAGLARNLVRKAPAESITWTWFGIAQAKAKNYPAAEKSLRTALGLKPEDRQALRELAKVYQGSGREEEASQIYHQLLASPGSPPGERIVPLLKLAIIEINNGRHQAAMPLIEEALAIEPDSPEAYYLIGLMAHRQGELDAAKKHFRRALEIYPAYPEPLISLGMIAMAQGDQAGARELLERAIKLGDNADAFYNMGLIAGKERNKYEARLWFERALEIDPNHPGALLGLGIDQADRKDYAAARASIERFLELSPSLDPNLKSIVYNLLASVYYNLMRSGGLPRAEFDAYAGRAAQLIKESNSPETGLRKREWESVTGKTFP